MRLDVAISKRFHNISRQKALMLIKNGQIFVNKIPIFKPSAQILLEDDIEIQQDYFIDSQIYCSRAAFKLSQFLTNYQNSGQVLYYNENLLGIDLLDCTTAKYVLKNNENLISEMIYGDNKDSSHSIQMTNADSIMSTNERDSLCAVGMKNNKDSSHLLRMTDKDSKDSSHSLRMTNADSIIKIENQDSIMSTNERDSVCAVGMRNNKDSSHSLRMTNKDSKDSSHSLRMTDRTTYSIQTTDKTTHSIHMANMDSLHQTPYRVFSNETLQIQQISKIKDSIRCQIKDNVILDVGASAGGFTQILLSSEALLVIAQDIGNLQLHSMLHNNPSVLSIENTDIRDFAQNKKAYREQILNVLDSMQNLKAKQLYNEFQTQEEKICNFLVCDVSFISLKNIFASLRLLSHCMLLLFKPQFEVGIQSKRNKKGVLKDSKQIQESLESFIAFLQSNHAQIIFIEKSLVKGKEGNEEFFIFCQFETSL